MMGGGGSRSAGGGGEGGGARGKGSAVFSFFPSFFQQLQLFFLSRARDLRFFFLVPFSNNNFSLFF